MCFDPWKPKPNHGTLERRGDTAAVGTWAGSRAVPAGRAGLTLWCLLAEGGEGELPLPGAQLGWEQAGRALGPTVDVCLPRCVRIAALR